MCLVHIKLELFTIMFKMGVSPLAFRVLKTGLYKIFRGNLEKGATSIIFTFLESLGPMAKIWSPVRFYLKI